jgi:hypothetical protein
MSLVTVATNVIERMPIPDAVTSAGISFLVDRTAASWPARAAGRRSTSPA